MINFIKLCRLEHWVKNGLVFLPPFFLGVMFDGDKLSVAAPAFLSFSLVASAVYVLNDINDRESDRMHPAKRNRPVASGAVGVMPAAALAAVLCVAGFGMLFWAHSRIWAAIVLAMYLLCNVAYSVGFKNTPLVDIFLLASGFVFRIFYGGFYFGIEISSWLFLCVFSSALYFACGKRKNEIARIGAMLQLAEIPAEIEVVAVDIRDLEDRAVGLQHEDVRHCGQTGRVHTVAQLV